MNISGGGVAKYSKNKEGLSNIRISVREFPKSWYINFEYPANPKINHSDELLG